MARIGAPESSGDHNRRSRWQLRVYGPPSSGPLLDGVEGQLVERLSTAEGLPDGVVVAATNSQRPVPASSWDPEVLDPPLVAQEKGFRLLPSAH